MTPSIRRLNWPVLALAAFLALCWGALLAGSAGLLRAETRLASGVSAVTVVPLPSAPGDSALVIASWGRGCDWRGCPSLYEVTWSATLGSVTRTVSVPRDSVSVPWPAWGDSLLVGVTVRAQRRGQWSGPALGAVVVRRPDAPPPTPDSLRVIADTLIAAAMRDSYPEDAHRWYSATGWQYRVDSLLAEGPDSLPVTREGRALAIEPGYAFDVCHWAVNRHSGVPLLFVPRDVEGVARQRHAEACTARVQQVDPTVPPPLPRAPATSRGA